MALNEDNILPEEKLLEVIKGVASPPVQPRPNPFSGTAPVVPPLSAVLEAIIGGRKPEPAVIKLAAVEEVKPAAVEEMKPLPLPLPIVPPVDKILEMINSRAVVSLPPLPMPAEPVPPPIADLPVALPPEPPPAVLEKQPDEPVRVAAEAVVSVAMPEPLLSVEPVPAEPEPAVIPEPPVQVEPVKAEAVPPLPDFSVLEKLLLEPLPAVVVPDSGSVEQLLPNSLPDSQIEAAPAIAADIPVPVAPLTVDLAPDVSKDESAERLLKACSGEAEVKVMAAEPEPVVKAESVSEEPAAIDAGAGGLADALMIDLAPPADVLVVAPLEVPVGAVAEAVELIPVPVDPEIVVEAPAVVVEEPIAAVSAELVDTSLPAAAPVAGVEQSVEAGREPEPDIMSSEPALPEPCKPAVLPKTKKLEPVRSAPAATKKLEAVRPAPAATKKLEPVRPAPAPTKKLEPAGAVPAETKRLEAVRPAPAETKRPEPVRQAPAATKRLEPVRQAPAETKKLEAVRPAPVVSVAEEQVEAAPQPVKPPVAAQPKSVGPSGEEKARLKIARPEAPVAVKAEAPAAVKVDKKQLQDMAKTKAAEEEDSVIHAVPPPVVIAKKSVERKKFGISQVNIGLAAAALLLVAVSAGEIFAKMRSDEMLRRPLALPGRSVSEQGTVAPVGNPQIPPLEMLLQGINERPVLAMPGQRVKEVPQAAGAGAEPTVVDWMKYVQENIKLMGFSGGGGGNAQEAIVQEGKEKDAKLHFLKAGQKFPIRGADITIENIKDDQVFMTDGKRNLTLR